MMHVKFSHYIMDGTNFIFYESEFSYVHHGSIRANNILFFFTFPAAASCCQFTAQACDALRALAALLTVGLSPGPVAAHLLAQVRAGRISSDAARMQSFALSTSSA